METILNVTGMSCGNCVKHVREALSPLPGVQRVDVELKEGRALIAHDGSTARGALLDAVRDAGYEASIEE